jgi:cell division protease FtsH
MEPKLGQVAYVAYEADPAPLLGVPAGADWRPRRYSEETASAIDTALRALVDAAFERAVFILTANRVVLDQAAAELLAKETFSAEDLQRVAARLTSIGPGEKTPRVAVGIAAVTRMSS